MSTSASATQHGDDLEDLYEEVWAVFSEDAISPNTEKETIYNSYENPPNANINVPPPSFNPKHPEPSRDIKQPPSSNVRPQPSQSQGRYRPLPLPPGASSPAAPTLGSVTIPESDICYDPMTAQAVPAPSNFDSLDPSGLLKQATTGSHRPPQPPVSFHDSGLDGAPGDELPKYGAPPESSSFLDIAHSPTTVRNQLYAATEWSPVEGYHNPAGVNRTPSTLPPGTLVPTVSSQNTNYDLRNGFDAYANDDSTHVNGYLPVDYRKLDPAHRGYSPAPPSLTGGLAAQLPSLSALPNVPEANSLPGSTVSTHQSDGYSGPTSMMGPSTTLNRGNSTSSYAGTSEWATIPYLNDPSVSHSSSFAKFDHPHDHFTDMEDNMAAAKGRGPLELHDDDDEEYWEEDEEDPTRFINFSLLSHIAVQLRDKVPRGTHVKGSIPYPRAFTGKDIVSTIQSQIQRELLINHGISTSDRRASLQVARSLQSQLFFYEVEWGGRVLQDGVEDVYMFLDDQEGGSDAPREREELPTGVITMLTQCYSPGCGEGIPCYSYSCPRKGNSIVGAPTQPEPPQKPIRKDWANSVEKEVLDSLPESEINRQTIIHKVISKEEQYLQDLDTVQLSFINPLRMANPPVIQPDKLEDFIDEVFGNILDLRECNRRLLEVMYVRQREQAPVIQRIGDVFLDAATEFRLAYPIYVGHLPLAEKRMKEELETNPEFRLFLERCSRHSAKHQEIRLDLKHLLNRPSEHLQKYPVLLDAIYHETAIGNPDADYLMEAIEAIKNLQTVAQLRTFQSAMGKGLTGKWEWPDLVVPEIRKTLTKEENKRQSIIFELIKGEMAYVKDLENIEIMYVRPLRNADPPIISHERLDGFLHDVFHNFAELHAHHRRMVDHFHEIQREEHPTIRSLTAAVFDAALNFREAYMQYIPNYPIAAYRVSEEVANNPAFKAFVEQCVRHPDAHRLDMKSFINRPIPRLLRYELLLKGILDETPAGHEDREAIPHVLDVIKALGKETEPGVMSSKQKVELWRYNSNLVFKSGESVDMDLLDENRSLIHTGKLLRQPDTGFEWSGWTELFVLLFDNYLVMTKPKEKDGIMKYHVFRRPIPLDLLTLANFTDPPTQRSAGILRGLRGGQRDGDTASQAPNGPHSPENSVDARAVFPCTLHHNGRLGGLYTVYAESAQLRSEWKQKLEEATGLRKVVQESNKVFEIETLSLDTFSVPAIRTGGPAPTWNSENPFTGKVTCSVPFTTPDGRGLVAIGCAEGVWIGFRHDSRSMRRVLHLKMVTQCAMLEQFGIFLVLADKSLFAYHMEALVPSSPHSAHTSQTPQKLNGTKDVHFFSVGTLHGRTLVIYMKKKNLESVFRVLEPVIDNINERANPPVGFATRLGLRAPRSEWFRIYRDFFLPSEAFDLFFLKAKIAILCTRGFEIMDLTDFKSVTIPQRDEPRLEKLAKRCESCRPMGMFRCNDDEFLLCYDEFGLHVDKHGDPSRSTGTIEWEGTAERVALHHPYVLLFDSRFIEVRHVETGRLAQIIPGNDIRCVWDGRGLNANPVTAPTSDGFDHPSQEPRVHGVMNAPDPVTAGGARPSRAVTQHVFELIPTIPLYLPGSLASPSTSTYFPQSFSPPHSPHLRPTSSWRS